MMGRGRSSFARAAAVFLSITFFCIGPGSAAEEWPKGVIARGKGFEIRGEVFTAYLGMLGTSPEKMSLAERKATLDRFMVDWWIANEAVKRKYSEAKNYRSGLDTFSIHALADLFFEKEFQEKASVKEEDYAMFFQGLTDMADISVILADGPERIQEIEERIASGMPFEEAASKFSVGLTKYKKGRVEGVTPGDPNYSAEERKAIFDAAPGAVVGPFENPTGFLSMIKVRALNRKEAQKEEIRRKNHDMIRHRKAEEAYLVRINEALTRSEIEINEEFFEENRGGEAQRPYLAWVKGRYIYPADVSPGGSHARIPLGDSKKALRQALDMEIQKIVAAEEARKAGLDRSREFRARLEAYRIQTLPNFFLWKRFDESASPLREDEVLKYYREFYTPEVCTIWLVMNRDRRKVEKAREEVLEGSTSLQQVARDYSTDMSRGVGGMVGPMSINRFHPSIRASMKDMAEGSLSQVLEIGDQYGVFRLLESRSVTVPDLTDVDDAIRSRLVLQRRSEFILHQREIARKKARYEVNARFLEKIR